MGERKDRNPAGRRRGGRLIFCLLLCLFFCVGCGDAREEALPEGVLGEGLSYVESLPIRYAENFSVHYYEDQDGRRYTLLSVPDNGRFLLLPEGVDKEAVTEVLPSDSELHLLSAPIQRGYLAASAAMDMLRAIDGIGAMRFSSQKTENWKIPEAREAMEAGTLAYAGKYSAPDYEALLSERCDIAIESTMILHAPEVYEKLEALGIPVLVDYASRESHPLGRVEWVKLYGALLSREEEAEEVFRAVQEDYEAAGAYTGREDTEAVTDGEKKTVAYFYFSSNGLVNVRKTKDYIPKMIAQAGGSYLPSEESLPETEDNAASTINLQREAFYQAAKEVDYLVYNGTITGEIDSIEGLLREEPLLSEFTAVQKGNVFFTKNDVYQQSMAIGQMTRDFSLMLSGNPEAQARMVYIHRATP